MSKAKLQQEWARLYRIDQERRIYSQELNEQITAQRAKKSDLDARVNARQEALNDARLEAQRETEVLDSMVTRLVQSNNAMADNMPFMKVVGYMMTDFNTKPFARMTLKEIRDSIPEEGEPAFTRATVRSWSKKTKLEFLNHCSNLGLGMNPEFQQYVC